MPIQGTDVIDTGPRAMPGATMNMPFQGADAIDTGPRAMPAALSRSQSPPIGAVVRGLTLRTTMKKVFQTFKIGKNDF